MNRGALLGLLLLVALAAAVMLVPEGDQPAEPTRGGGALSGAPESCLPCHAQVVDEWRASMHAASFTDPQVRAPEQSDNFRKTECIPCHAARPVFEHGIEEGTRVLARVQRRQDGVDCLSCHGLPDGGVAASSSGRTAVCQPDFRADLATQALCAPCHNQHNTHDEWRASPAAAEGQSCRDCHMPRVNRTGSEAGAPRAGRSHRFLGGRDPEFALPGLELSADVAPGGDTLVASLTNSFAGHNLPTDSRNRALDMVVTLYDARGAELPRLTEGDRYPGGETGTKRRRFRKPYRSSGNPSTELPAGETATLEVPLPPQAARAAVELFYKLQPWIPDTEATWTTRIEVPLPARG